MYSFVFFLSISIAYKRIQAHKYQICIRYSRYAIDQYNYTHNGTALRIRITLYNTDIYKWSLPRIDGYIYNTFTHMYV